MQHLYLAKLLKINLYNKLAFAEYYEIITDPKGFLKSLIGEAFFNENYNFTLKEIANIFGNNAIYRCKESFAECFAECFNNYYRIQR